MLKNWGTHQMVMNREKFGNRCHDCGMREEDSEKLFGKPLEFHHIKPTGVKGMGRGKNVRAADVRDNPKSYILLCRRCHKNRHPERFPHEEP